MRERDVLHMTLEQEVAALREQVRILSRRDSKQKEVIIWVLEPALKFYREGPEQEIAEQALRKLEEMRQSLRK
jgi:hypothetical protein